MSLLSSSLLSALALPLPDAPATHRVRAEAVEVNLPTKMAELLTKTASGDADTAALQQQLKLAKRTGDVAVMKKTLVHLGLSAEAANQFDSAARYYEQYIRMAGEESPAAAAAALNAAAISAELASDLGGACRLHGASVEAAEAAEGTPTDAIVTRLNLARMLLKAGEADAALSVVIAAARLAERDGDKKLASVAALLQGIAAVADVAGRVVPKDGKDASVSADTAAAMLRDPLSTLMDVQARPVLLPDARGNTGYPAGQIADVVTLRDRWRVLQAIALANHVSEDVAKCADAAFEAFVAARVLKDPVTTRRAAVNLAVASAHSVMADRIREAAAAAVRAAHGQTN